MPLTPILVKRLIFFIFIAIAISLISLTSLKYTSGDFDIFYGASQNYMAKAPVYQSHEGIEEFKYSPLFALLFSPLTILNKKSALYVWTVLNIISLFFIFYFFFKLKQFSLDHPKDFLIIVCLFALTGRYVFLDFRLGQVNIFLCMLMVLIMYLEMNSKYFLASVVLAFSLMIKFFPLLFVLYFLLRRRFELLAYTLLMVAVFLFLPSVYSGFSLNLKYLHDWFILLRSSPPALLYSVKNCSLLSYFSWVFVASHEHCRVLDYNLIQRGLVPAVYYAWLMSCFVFIASFFYTTFFDNEKDPQVVYLDYSCLFVLGLLFNPLAYLNALVFLIIPYFFILRYLFYSKLSKKYLFLSGSFVLVSLILTLFDNRVFFKDPYFFDFILKFKPLMWAIIYVYLALLTLKYSIKLKS